MRRRRLGFWAGLLLRGPGTLFLGAVLELFVGKDWALALVAGPWFVTIALLVRWQKSWPCLRCGLMDYAPDDNY